MFEKICQLALALFPALAIASAANSQIQEAAYILNSSADTSKALELLGSALASEGSDMREKLSASLYLARVAEARGDSAAALKHYRFAKDNAQSQSLAYAASEKESALGGSKRVIKLAKLKGWAPSREQSEAPSGAGSSRFAHCRNEGEIKLAQHIIYNCHDYSLRLISKKNGAETWNVPFTGAFAKAFPTFDGFFSYSENTLSFYRIGDGLDLVWRIPVSGVQDLDIRGDRIFVLDISGGISLLSKNSGQKLSAAQSDGEAFFKAGAGLVGTYQKNGGISVFDSLLNHLWDYQIDGEVLDKPVISGDSVIFGLANEGAEILYTKHYQKFSQAVGSNADSLFSIESGNAFAWYNLALQNNSDSAWRRAIIYGSRKREPSGVIFAKYAEKIGAKWVRHLPVSSKMLYPKILSDAGSLFIWDSESQNLLRISAETGSASGSVELPKDMNKDMKYEVMDYEQPWFMLNSDYRLSRFSLKEQKAVSFDVPGKPLSFLYDKDSVYIGLMNGFALKYIAPKMRLEWSRKVSSAPVFLSLGEAGAYSFSQGKISLLSSKGGGEFSVDLGSAGYFKSMNGIFAAASAAEDGTVHIYYEKKGFSQPETFSVGMPIVSLELLESDGKAFALAGLSNQTFSLFELPGGKLAWSFSVKGSASMQAVQRGRHIWLDREDAIVALDIGTGKIAKSYKILGSGASILIHGGVLYCVTPQKLLYAFPIN